MKKILSYMGYFSLPLILILVITANSFACHDVCIDTLPTDLIAGQNIVVGEVDVSYDSDTETLTVTYTITESGWTMTETHLYVGSTPPDSAAPGQFPYKHDPLDHVTVDVYEVQWPACGEIHIAAHAVVKKCPDEPSQPYNPFPDGEGNIILWGASGSDVYGVPVRDSYFTVTVGDDTYESWCVDLYHSIKDGSYYVETGDNLADSDIINWIINNAHGFTVEENGEVYELDLGKYWHWLIVQYAIWYITDGPFLSEDDDWDDWNPSSQYDGEEAKILFEALLEAAWAEGPGYEPEVGDKTFILLHPSLPDGTRKQDIIVVVIVPPSDCQEETAWAYGCRELPTGWGWSFKFDTGEPCDDGDGTDCGDCYDGCDWWKKICGCDWWKKCDCGSKPDFGGCDKDWWKNKDGWNLDFGRKKDRDWWNWWGGLCKGKSWKSRSGKNSNSNKWNFNIKADRDDRRNFRSKIANSNNRNSKGKKGNKRNRAGGKRWKKSR